MDSDDSRTLQGWAFEFSVSLCISTINSFSFVYDFSSEMIYKKSLLMMFNGTKDIVLLIMLRRLLIVLIFYLQWVFKFPFKVLEINVMQRCFLNEMELIGFQMAYFQFNLHPWNVVLWPSVFLGTFQNHICYQTCLGTSSATSDKVLLWSTLTSKSEQLGWMHKYTVIITYLASQSTHT